MLRRASASLFISSPVLERVGVFPRAVCGVMVENGWMKKERQQEAGRSCRRASETVPDVAVG